MRHATCHLDRKHHAKGLCKACYDTAKGKANPGRSAAWRKANPERAKAQRRAQYRANPEKSKAQAVAWARANWDKVKARPSYNAITPARLATRKATSKANSNKLRAVAAAWAKANPGKHCAKSAKRHAAKLRRTPPWITKEQLVEIQSFYILAKEIQWLSEEVLEVDHIVPLQGENVSGLHVPWNLQILPKSINASKSNQHK
jgi:hypothetical protein